MKPKLQRFIIQSIQLTLTVSILLMPLGTLRSIEAAESYELRAMSNEQTQDTEEETEGEEEGEENQSEQTPPVSQPAESYEQGAESGEQTPQPQPQPQQTAIPSTGLTLDIEEHQAPLHGGELTLYADITNTRSSRSYKISLETILPQGITYKAIGEVENPENNQYRLLQPTITTENNQQELTWNNVADLLPGETITIPFTLELDGEPTWYIQDQIAIELIATQYENVLDTEPISQTAATYNGTIQALRITVDKNTEHVTGADTYQYTNEITIQNNHERASEQRALSNEPGAESDGQTQDAEQNNTEPQETQDAEEETEQSGELPAESGEQTEDAEEGTEEKEEKSLFVTITETLARGITYLTGSQQVETNHPETQETLEIVEAFSVQTTQEGETILQWLLRQLLPSQEVHITYDTTSPYQEKSDQDTSETEPNQQTGDIIQDDEEYTRETQATGTYQVRGETTDKVTQEIIQQKVSTITTQYLHIDKYLSHIERTNQTNTPINKKNILPGDQLTFSINTKTSDYYEFPHLIITDTIPDGFTYLNSETQPTAITKQPDGTTQAIWELHNTPPGTTTTFTYTIQVDNTYTDGLDITSRNYFTNTIDITGEWIDIIQPQRETETSSDTDSAWSKTPQPTITATFWNPWTQIWEQNITTNTNQYTQLKLHIQFPEVPTQNVQIRNYIPPFTVQNRDIQQINTAGTFENDPTEIAYEQPTAEKNSNNGIILNFGDVSASATWEAIIPLHIPTQEEQTSDPETPEQTEQNNLTPNNILRNLTRLDYTNNKTTSYVETDQAALRIVNPRANITINEGVAYTNSELIQKDTTATVPDTSTTREARYLSCESQESCNTTETNPNWSTWQQHTKETMQHLDYVKNRTAEGEKTFCIQARDDQNRQSSVSCDTILLDITPPNGTVQLREIAEDHDNNPETTTSMAVQVQLSNLNDPLLSDGNNGSGIATIQYSTNGRNWETLTLTETELQTIQDTGSYTIPRVTLPGSSGLQTIFINLIDHAGNTLRENNQPLSDTIYLITQGETGGTYTIQYGVDYQPTENYQQNIYSNQNTFTLTDFPKTAETNQTTTLVLDVTNTGNFTWYPATYGQTSIPHPVNISYHWYTINEQTGEKTIYNYEGNRAFLSKPIAPGETDYARRLPVRMPSIPGTYELVIDTVHEGKTWLSEQGQETPTFNITITGETTQNPEGLPDYERDDDFGLGESEEQGAGSSEQNTGESSERGAVSGEQTQNTEEKEETGTVLGTTNTCTSTTTTTIYTAPVPLEQDNSQQILTTIPAGIQLTLGAGSYELRAESGEQTQETGQSSELRAMSQEQGAESGEQTQDTEERNWVQVILSDGRIGWVQEAILQAQNCVLPDTNQFNPDDTQQNTTNTNEVMQNGDNTQETGNTPSLEKETFTPVHICNTQQGEIRFTPSWNSPALGTYFLGTPLYHMSEITNQEGRWIQVMTMQGLTGWILHTFVCEGFDPVPIYNTTDEIRFVRPYEDPGINPNTNEPYPVPITSEFGERFGQFHSGTDYGLYCGLDIYAAAEGEVIAVGTDGIVQGNQSTPQTPSNFVKIQHTSDRGEVYETWYWHLDEIFVQVGATVTQGETIATAGNTGYVRGNDASPQQEQGCHLHFEIRKTSQEGNTYPVDSELYLQYGELINPETITHEQANILGLGIGASREELITVNETQLKGLHRLNRPEGDVPNYLYTIDQGEVQSARGVGYVDEGIKMFVPLYEQEQGCLDERSRQTYRFFHEGEGLYFYTIDIAEVLGILAQIPVDEAQGKPTYKPENSTFCGYSEQIPGTSPVYRLRHNKNRYLYTTNKAEAEAAAQLSEWTFENERKGVFFVVKPEDQYTFKLHEYLDAKGVPTQNRGIGGFCGSVYYDYKKGNNHISRIVYNPFLNQTFEIPARSYSFENPVNAFVNSFLEVYESGGCHHLGLPVSGMEKVVNSLGEEGFVQQFDNGLIIGSRNGTFPVWGTLYPNYIEEGASAGFYGFPIDVARYDELLGVICQEFEGGTLCGRNFKICGDSHTALHPNRFCDDDQDGLEDRLEDELMRRFAPVIILDDEEDLLPANVDWTLARTSLKFIQRHSTQPDCETDVIHETIFTQKRLVTGVGEERRRNCTRNGNRVSSRNDSEDRFFTDLKNASFRNGIQSDLSKDWKVYGHVYSVNQIIFIQYWYYLPYNSFGFVQGVHQGDWEHITIRLGQANGQYELDEVYYAAHNSDVSKEKYVFPREEVFLFEKERPIVYIGKGTHASFRSAFDAEKTDINPVVGKEDANECSLFTDSGIHNDKQGVPIPIPAPIVTDISCKGPSELIWHSKDNIQNMGEKIYPRNDQHFLYFTGRWGRRSLDIASPPPQNLTQKVSWVESW